MKLSRHLLAGLILSSIILTAHQAQGQPTNFYFDDTGDIVNGGTYSWDAASWSSGSGGPFTANWAPATLANFYASPSYTVTVNASESMAGMYLYSSGSLTVSDAGNNTGSLEVVTNSGDNVNNVDNSYFQQFICSISSGSANVIINVPVTGAGGVEQNGFGNLYLLGTNSYAGGTEPFGGENIYFNNSASFGTGHIVLGTSYGPGNPSIDSALINNTASVVTIPNGLSFAMDGDSVILANVPGGSTIYSGPVDLGAAGGSMEITSSSGTNILSGVISDGAALTIDNSSLLILSGANTYTGTTTLAGGTVQLGAANVIAASTNLVLDGGTLDPGGYNQTFAPLTLASSSTIDFEAGACELDFANSSNTASAWNGTLNLANWNPTADKLRFGTDTNGLTTAQIQSITFDGTNAPTAEINASGYLIIPVPIGPTILPPSVSGTNIDFSFATVTNQSYSILATTNLAPANWITVTNFTGDGKTDQVMLPLTGPQQFYRVSQ